MRVLLVVGVILFLVLRVSAQVAPDKYVIEFTDKNNSPFSIDHPDAFLSQRAIDRRIRFGIPVTSQDFPVNTSYVEAVRATGVKYIQQMKWLNAIVIKTSDTLALEQIAQLPFVKKVIKKTQPEEVKGEFEPLFSLTPGSFTEHVYPTLPSGDNDSSGYDYGEAYSQVSMVGGTGLHDRGFRGLGTGIAVLDGGFSGANQMAVFDSMRDNQRLKGTLNLVGGGSFVYQGTSHGSAVLSIMAADAPGLMIGTAPMADYWLIRTEDVNTEYILEEYNWVTGAEYADSAGADMIVSSLSYRTFIDNATSHTYEQTDGNTAPVTIGADIACSKGMIVVVSAGNSGQEWEWPYIGFPADGDSVFTVGAVDAHGIYAPFSSRGPTVDGRIKPDAAARGVATIVALPDGSIGAADGTSYSTPILAGMISCLWQAFPAKPNMAILEAVKKSSSKSLTPDTLVGWGIPDFMRAFDVLTGTGEPKGDKAAIHVYPNPFSRSLSISLPSRDQETVRVEISDMSGRKCLQKDAVVLPGRPVVQLEGLGSLPAGIYLLRLTGKDTVFIEKIIKQ